MIELTPETRLEKDIEAIINDSTVQNPITRIEKMLSSIAAGELVTITPVTRIEKYLANISGLDIEIPKPVTRIEMFLAAIAGYEIVLPKPITRLEYLLQGWLDNWGELTTLTGDVITFNAKRSAAINSLIVSLEPIQDLHGQDSPYPAGGGVNKLNLVDQYVYQAGGGKLWGDGYLDAVNTLTDTGFTSTNRNSSYGPRIVAGYYEADETLTVSAIVSNGSLNVSYITNEPAIGSAYTGITGTSGTSGSRKYITFTMPASGYLLIGAYANNTTDIIVSDLVLSLGSTVPTAYSPYSNICPITGWTGCKVFHTGKNMYDPSIIIYQMDAEGKFTVGSGTGSTIIETGQSSSSAVISDANYKKLLGLPAGHYCGYVKCHDNSAITIGTIRTVSPVDKKTTNLVSLSTDSNGNCTFEFTLTEYTKIVFRLVQSNLYYSNLMIAPYSLGAEYKPYSGTTASVTFPDTVYGGSYEFVSGGLTSKMASVDLGTRNWSYRNGCFDATIGSGKKAGYSTGKAKAVCSQYIQKAEVFSSLANGEMAFGSGYVNSSTCSVIIKDTRYTDAASFKTAMSDVQLVYELATPIEIQLTPQQISSLRGMNNIWSDGELEIKIPASSIEE